MKFSIGAKIAAGYLLALAALLVTGVVAYNSTTKLVETGNMVSHTHEVLASLENIVSTAKDVETGQRGYALTGEDSFLQPFHQGTNEIFQDVEALRVLTKDNPNQQRRIDTLLELVKKKVAYCEENVRIRATNGVDGAQAHILTGLGKKYMDEIRRVAQEMETEERDLLKSRSGVAEATVHTSNLTIVGGTIAAFVLLSLVGIWITRSISRPLRDITGVAERIAGGDFTATVPDYRQRDEVGELVQAFARMNRSLQEAARLTDQIAQGNLTVTPKPQSEKDLLGNAQATMVDRLSGMVGQVQRSGIQVNTSATEIAATAKQQQTTANEIVSTTNEIGATSKEISATSKELVKTMGEVSRVAEDTARMATESQNALTRMQDTIRKIMEASGSISSKLGVLNEKAGNIGTVVTTISKVADQTNLLSLNAAIEAEKAGEYGLGFAVVATEIRRLADQTAVATYDIEQMVKEIQSAVSAGVMGMDKFSEEVRRGTQDVQQVGTQLNQIITQVQALTPEIESVNEGMQAQATGAGQISDALAQLSEAVQQTAESLRQSNLAIEQLNEASRGMQSSVAKFRLKQNEN